MSACVSPCFTVRSTPRRISFVTPSLAVTETCRLRISSVATSVTPSQHGDGVAQSDIDVIAVDLDGIDGHRAIRRKAGRAAAAQVESRPVQPALDRAVGDFALG